MTNTDKNCISCGMPMRAVEEFAAGDTSRDYCVYCARPDGSMKSYDEALEGMTAFVTHTQGLDPLVARNTAATLMSKQPAWKGR